MRARLTKDRDDRRCASPSQNRRPLPEAPHSRLASAAPSCFRPCPSQARYNGAVMLERDAQAWVLKALREAGGSLLSELASLDEDILRWRPGARVGAPQEVAAP